MKCPRCVQRIHRAATACPHCGFSLQDADQVFEGVGLEVESLMDAAGAFRRRDRVRIEDALVGFMTTFPQLFVAVYTSNLADTESLREFGFWLLNRAQFVDLPEGKENAAGILIVIDPDSKTAGMSFGYLLEPFLDEEDTFECLSRAHSYWLEGRYGEGVLKVIRHLHWLLARRSRSARRNPKKYGRKVAAPVAVEDLAERIRGGRRADESSAEEREVVE